MGKGWFYKFKWGFLGIRKSRLLDGEEQWVFVFETMENKETESRVFDSITISITLGTVEGVSLYKYSFFI